MTTIRILKKGNQRDTQQWIAWHRAKANNSRQVMSKHTCERTLWINLIVLRRLSDWQINDSTHFQSQNGLQNAKFNEWKSTGREWILTYWFGFYTNWCAILSLLRSKYLRLGHWLWLCPWLSPLWYIWLSVGQTLCILCVIAIST